VVLTIWGFFLGMRFPHDDWFMLPVLETLYYAVGAQLEDERPGNPAEEHDGHLTRGHPGRDLGVTPSGPLRSSSTSRPTFRCKSWVLCRVAASVNRARAPRL
jgi:hypothetical protein